MTPDVAMQNNLFSPVQISVKVGQKIHWTNNDGYPHNVTATKGATFRSDNVDYVCTIDPGQTGTITVTK
jgi:plastocyanin